MSRAPALGVLLLGLLFLAPAALGAEEHGAMAQYEGLKNPLNATPETLKAGKTLYEARCASCHLVSGKGALPGQPDFTSAVWSKGAEDDHLFSNISEGLRAMPAFKSSLTETERWQVLTYIRSLSAEPAAGTGAPPTPTPTLAKPPVRTPGFEAAAALGAMGAALLALGRRRG